MKINHSYTAGYNSFLIESFSDRKAAKELAFMLPYVQKKMSILDCGCGPGTMTLELAKLAAPGKVIGLDIEGDQFKKTEIAAGAENIQNICFVEAGAYNLPFDEGSFDLVLFHALLFHLSKPEKALKEAYRVLHEGGLICCRDSYISGDIYYPQCDELDRAIEISKQIIRYCKGDPDFGLIHADLLSKAGFSDLKRSACYDYIDSGKQVKALRTYLAYYISQLHYDLIIENNWSSVDDIQGIIKALKQWGNNRYAFYARSRCEIIAKKK